MVEITNERIAEMLGYKQRQDGRWTLDKGQLRGIFECLPDWLHDLDAVLRNIWPELKEPKHWLIVPWCRDEGGWCLVHMDKTLYELGHFTYHLATYCQTIPALCEAICRQVLYEHREADRAASISNIIHDALVAKGADVRSLASMLGVPIDWAAAIESGGVRIEGALARALADVLDRPELDLLDRPELPDSP